VLVLDRVRRANEDESQSEKEKENEIEIEIEIEHEHEDEDEDEQEHESMLAGGEVLTHAAHFSLAKVSAGCTRLPPLFND
jgi:hypothetical protein